MKAVLTAFVVALLVHLPAVSGDFVFFDDYRFVVENPAIDDLGNTGRFFTDLDTTAAPGGATRDIYRPLRTLSYAVVNSVAGKEDPRPFHALSILLHACCVAALAAVLLAAGAVPWMAAVGALAFGLHPVVVEVTAWICSLGDLWCGLFSLLAILLWARDRIVWAHLFLLLALLGKEHAVVVPGIWLAWDFFLRPERWRASISRGPLPGLVLVGAFLFWRSWLGAVESQVAVPLGGSHWNATLTMLSGMGFYGARILLPHEPSFQARVAVPDFALPMVLGVVVLAALFLALRYGTSRLRLAAAWFLMGLVPVSNLFVTLKIPTADRFLYLPLMGLSLAVVELCRRFPRQTSWGLPAVLVVLGALSIHRTGDWKDDRALVRAGLRVAPKSRMLLWADASVRAQEALAAMQRGDFTIAELEVNEARRLYSLYLKNAGPEENTIQVWREVGDLTWEWGYWLLRTDLRGPSIQAHGDALRYYLAAHKLQREGKGRVIDREVRHVAERAAQLCVRLSRRDNPNLVDVFRIGNGLLDFLAAEYKADVTLLRAQLLLPLGIRLSAGDPSKAREAFDKVLGWAGEQEGTAFLRAQALYHRALLPPTDRASLERSRDLFLEAALQGGEIRLRASVLAARSCCALATRFGDPAMARKGLALLDALGEIAASAGLRIPNEMAAEVANLRSRCSVR